MKKKINQHLPFILLVTILLLIGSWTELFANIKIVTKISFDTEESHYANYSHEVEAILVKDNISKYAIFFNTYSSNSTELADYIIKSQLQAIHSQPILDGAPLFYTRIGNLDWDWPLSECENKVVVTANMSDVLTNETSGIYHSNRKCIEIAAVPVGDEMLTISKLHKYCQVPQNKDRKVVYIHSKGTYTVNFKNDQLRTILMKAVLSSECLQVSSSNLQDDGKNLSDCNTCSTRFNLFPFLTYLGNMWVAECDYISKLIDPDEFKEKKQNVIDIMLNQTHRINHRWYETRLHNDVEYKFQAKQFQWIQRESWIGVGRYAAEHWIASHPDVLPCEVFAADSNPKIEYGRVINVADFANPVLHHIQHTMTSNASESFWITNNMKSYVYHPWYAEGGRLFEYIVLYNKVPNKDSWFYTFWSKYPK